MDAPVVEVVSFGKYSLPVVLMVALSFAYRALGDKVGNRLRSPIAIAIGVVLGLCGLVYQGGPWDGKHIIDFVLYGFMSGASAVGLYEAQRAALRPRP